MQILSRVCGALNLCTKLNSSKCAVDLKKILTQAFRQMSGGHERTMHITPSRFQYTRFKDDLHFYISIGVIPLGILILGVNIFIGPAELTETPEGYVPKAYEYHRHPIKRFFVKYFLEDPQVAHERTLHFLNEEMERADWKIKTDKVKKLMAERDDYKGWYFIPSRQGLHYRQARKEYDSMESSKGYR